MRTSKLIELAHRIHDLVDDGWEYPGAEWAVIKDLKDAPNGEELLQAYNDVEEDR